MPTVTFNPAGLSFDVDTNVKLLLAATRNKVKIRFGCASCRCGTCGVAVTLAQGGVLTEMRPDEEALLTRMKLPTDGTVRLACQARIVEGEVAVDLEFQNSYSPDDGEDDSGET